MKMNKKKGFYLGIGLVAVMVTTGIFAYYTDIQEKKNTITVGYNEIEIVEEYNPPKELKPGISFTKDVKVKNTGTVPCYVRVFCEVNNSDVKDMLKIDYNNQDFTKKGEYYYYNDILQPKTSTPSLMTTVQVSDTAEVNQMKDFDIIVYSESVQQEGYKDSDSAWAAFIKK